jgi:CRP-like cAMP-binding protein
MAGYDRALYQIVLRNIPMFATCSAEQLDHLAELGELDTYPDGKPVVSEGDVADAFFVVTSGSLGVERGGHQVATLHTGSYFGELALLDPAPRNATVRATGGPASVVRISQSSFRAALDQTPALRDAIMQGMARRIHQLDRRDD